jgi:hypothetical protein
MDSLLGHTNEIVLRIPGKGRRACWSSVAALARIVCGADPNDHRSFTTGLGEVRIGTARPRPRRESYKGERMSTTSRSVSRPVVFEVIGPEMPMPVEAELRYDPADPYAVAVAFQSYDTEVLWVFGRDLLLRGISEPTGDGDVQVFPSLDDDGRAEIGLVLRSPGGQTLMKVPGRDVMDFLAHSARSVWPGTEGDHVSADRAIAAILVD